MNKSSRHSKITGDFAEALVLYWLSKAGYECARVDHTGIDLLAFSKDHSKRIGISVKCRSRYDGTEHTAVNLPPDGFLKAQVTCEIFGCEPYYAIVVDSTKGIQCFLLSLDHLQQLATGTDDRMRYWQMSDEFLQRCCTDREIQRFELHLENQLWPDASLV